jgi:hypothetical protein
MRGAARRARARGVAAAPAAATAGAGTNGGAADHCAGVGERCGGPGENGGCTSGGGENGGCASGGGENGGCASGGGENGGCAGRAEMKSGGAGGTGTSSVGGIESMNCGRASGAVASDGGSIASVTASSSTSEYALSGAFAPKPWLGGAAWASAAEYRWLSYLRVMLAASSLGRAYSTRPPPRVRLASPGRRVNGYRHPCAHLRVSVDLGRSRAGSDPRNEPRARAAALLSRRRALEHRRTPARSAAWSRPWGR